jgi:hypothetical protein
MSVLRKGRSSSIKRRRTRDNPLKASHLKLDSFMILVLHIACFINVYEIA